MMITSDGIDRVRAYVLASGIGAYGGSIGESAVLVSWRSEHDDKLFQVYVDGEFAAVTNDCCQRSIVLPIRLSQAGASEIEVFAVECGYWWVDDGVRADSVGVRNRVRVSWVRGMSLPVEGRAEVYGDGGSGEVDYEFAITNRPLCLWPGWQDRCGFGLSEFGKSDFGFDGSAAVGFGRGDFGVGEFGFDADVVSWESGEKQTGVYKFGVKVVDEFGNSSSGVESEEVMVIATAEPGEGLAVESYDKVRNELVLSVS